MVEFIKTCDQYPRRFNFVNFFNSIILSSPLSTEEKISLENAVREEWVISFFLGDKDKNLGESFDFQFFYSQMYLPVILTLLI